MNFLSDVLITDAYNVLVAAAEFTLFVIGGYIVASLLGGVTKDVIKKLKVEKMLKQAGVGGNIVSISIANVTSIIVFFYVFLFFLALGGEVARLKFLLLWSQSAMAYLTSAVQGVVILAVGFVIGGYLSKVIAHEESMWHRAAGFFTELFIEYNALVIALPMLLPNADVSILKSSFLVMLFGISLGGALAMGIGLGLGAQDVIKKKMKVWLKNEKQ